DALGGRENVNSVAHCATRLRVMVKDGLKEKGFHEASRA
ncbi:PTS transporter subunit EIIB, partial [Streptococcus salivarius]